MPHKSLYSSRTLQDQGKHLSMETPNQLYSSKFSSRTLQNKGKHLLLQTHHHLTMKKISIYKILLNWHIPLFQCSHIQHTICLNLMVEIIIQHLNRYMSFLCMKQYTLFIAFLAYMYVLLIFPILARNGDPTATNCSPNEYSCPNIFWR